MRLPLAYYAAIQGIRGLDVDAMRRVVDELTDEGAWDDDFINVIDAVTTADAQAPFESALGRLGASVRTKEDAVWYLIDFHTGRIARGEIDPLQGLSAMIRDVYWDYDFGERSAEYIGDSHAIEGLVGTYFEHSDWLEARWPSVTEDDFRQEALKFAQEWQANRSR